MMSIWLWEIGPGAKVDFGAIAGFAAAPLTAA